MWPHMAAIQSSLRLYRTAETGLNLKPPDRAWISHQSRPVREYTDRSSLKRTGRLDLVTNTLYNFNSVQYHMRTLLPFNVSDDGYYKVHPTHRHQSGFICTFERFIYLFTVIISLLMGIKYVFSSKIYQFILNAILRRYSITRHLHIFYFGIVIHVNIII